MPNTFQPEKYDELLSTKVTATKNLFNLNLEPEIFPSLKQNYRMRAEFRVWHENDDLFYIMFNKDTKEKIKINSFPQASLLINEIMPILINKIKTQPILRSKLFQIDFLSTLNNQILVSFLYHRQLNDEWQEQMNKLKNELDKTYNISIIGRAKKQKIVLGNDFVIEKLKVFNQEIIYQQVENSFTQPNAFINQKMLEWAVQNSKNFGGDLLELYCGNGNFSLALAQNFDKILATEISKSSVNSAQFNIAENNINNVKILKLSAEEFTQANEKVREFRRLKNANVNLNEYSCETILVDPPRAGLDPATIKMIQKYKNIIYISCNPKTLKDNLNILQQTHKVKNWALFDQFPYTDHIETAIILKKI